MNLDKFAAQKIHILKKENIFRQLSDCQNIADGIVCYNGQKLISFCSNDYFGLSQNQQVIEAALAACNKYGVGSGASRLISGNYPLYKELEEKISRLKHSQDSCVFGSGYMANIGVIRLIAGKGDVILSDKLIHSSLHDGISLSHAKHIRFAHNNVDSLLRQIKKHRRQYNNCIIVTETVFSMDGDIAPMAKILQFADEYNCFIISDDAHGIGLIRDNYDSDKHIQLGTLSKAVGSYGGYVAGSKKLIDYIKSSAKSLIYSTALPPSVVAASIAALDIIHNEGDELAQKALRNAQIFTDIMGLKKAQNFIIPVIIGDTNKALEIADKLAEAGFLVKAIRPPTVPAKTSRLRFTFSSIHDERDVIKLAETTKRLL